MLKWIEDYIKSSNAYIKALESFPKTKILKSRKRRKPKDGDDNVK